MPYAASLKAKLGKEQLPTVSRMLADNLQHNLFFVALEEVCEMLLNAENSIDVPAEQRINSITLDISVEALMMAVVAHLIERTIFQWFPDRKWVKDDILIPLDDVAMFLMCKQMFEGVEEIFEIISGSKADGCLGWISPARWQSFKTAYAQM